MKYTAVFLVVFLSVVCVNQCKDLIEGTSSNNRLIHQEMIEYDARAFMKRIKHAFFSDPGQQIIKGVVARDLDDTNAIASITAGGVGFSYVNMTFKSERGSGLNYQLEIYS